MAGAVSLARALLALWRSQASGVLVLRTELGTSRFAIGRGVVHAASALPCFDDAIGDALMQAGALDLRAHAHEGSLRSEVAAAEPVGAWLVRRGLTTRPALEATLRRQLRDRVVAVFGCMRIEYAFDAGASSVALLPIAEPMNVADLTLAGLRAQLTRQALSDCTEAIPEGALRLNPLGRRVTEAAALWPQEAAAAALLRRGTTLEELCRVTRSHRRALEFVAALVMLGAVEVPRGNRQFSLLLRKRAQMRRGAGARALLELGRDASAGEARRALKRLARSLHPDAFEAHASEALVAASGEVMGALIEAERELSRGAR